MAENAAGLLQQSSNMLAHAVQELSSGSKIVTPADDPAGLAVSIGFVAESNRIDAANQNVSNATSYTQTQDGFLQQVGTALDRMSTLATLSQDATETDSNRANYNAEYQQLASYVTNVTNKSFNGVSLFDGTNRGVTIDGDGETWNMVGISLTATAYTGATGAGVGTTTAAVAALTAVETAITQLATDRASIGANESRLNYTSNQLNVEKTNIDAANSAIADVNVATESTQYSKLQILVQSGTAMLAQANSIPQTVLKLIGA